MENITYFTGAGASYHSLPLIRTMNARMKAFSTYLVSKRDEGILKHPFADQFIRELNELIEIETQKVTIDSYARELSISTQPGSKVKLIRLKSILSSYLIFEQLKKPKELVLYSDNDEFEIKNSPKVPLEREIQEMIKTPIDKRYSNFWGDYISETKDVLPDNIKIISWNYDRQFESSYSEIKNCSLGFAQDKLQVFPSISDTINLSRSCILKLNGTAGLYNGLSKRKFNLFESSSENELIEQLDFFITPFEANYNHLSSDRPLLTFAWEAEDIVNQTRQLAKQILQETTILIIIGYSFPVINRIVDRSIFESIPKLKNIYFQAPEDEMDELFDKLDAINPGLKSLATPVKNLSTFHVPNEFYS